MNRKQESNPNSFLTDEDVARMRHLYGKPLPYPSRHREVHSYRTLAKAFKCSYSQVRQVVLGLCWRDCPVPACKPNPYGAPLSRRLKRKMHVHFQFWGWPLADFASLMGIPVPEGGLGYRQRHVNARNLARLYGPDVSWQSIHTAYRRWKAKQTKKKS